MEMKERWQIEADIYLAEKQEQEAVFEKVLATYEMAGKEKENTK